MQFKIDNYPCFTAFLNGILAIPGLKATIVTLLTTIEAQVILTISLLQIQLAQLNVVYTISQTAFNSIDSAMNQLNSTLSYVFKPLSTFVEGCPVVNDFITNLTGWASSQKTLNVSTHYSNLKKLAKITDIQNEIEKLNWLKAQVTAGKDYLISQGG